MTTDLIIRGRGDIPNERFLFVNGMMTPESWVNEIGDLISWLHGDVNVYCIADLTKGFFRDLVECSQLTLGVQTEGSERVARTVKNLLRQMEAETPGREHTIHVFCHSKGGLSMENAMELLNEDEKRQLDIKLVATPAVIDPDSVKSVHAYRGAEDPISFLSLERAGEMTTETLPTIGEGFMERHILQHDIRRPTYVALLQREGTAFLATHPVGTLPMDTPHA